MTIDTLAPLIRVNESGVFLSCHVQPGADIRKLLDLPPEDEVAPVLSGDVSAKPADSGASAPADKKDDGGDPPRSGDEVSVKTF